jgi:hypothetical protein
LKWDPNHHSYTFQVPVFGLIANFVLVLIQSRHYQIEIYMFQLPESYKLVIIYEASLSIYIVYRLNSQGFIDEFGEDNEI